MAKLKASRGKPKTAARQRGVGCIVLLVLGMLIAIQILFALLISMFSGAGPAAIAEIFPTRSRSTWMTAGYALSVAIFGGFAPYISVWMIDHFGSPTVHIYYLIAAAVVSTAVIWGLEETAFDELA